MSNDRLLQALTDAIRAEVEGHAFYLMAAKTTTDEQGRSVFERLGREELDHAAFLRRQYDAILETGKVADIVLGVPDVPAGTVIFSNELRGRIGEANFEITALSIGAQLEQTAMEFYRGQSEDAADEQVRAFFLELADWEKGHYRMLTAQLETLHRDFWAENRFSPF